MFKLIYQFLIKPIFGIPITISIFIIFPFIISQFFSLTENIIFDYFLYFLILAALIEIIFISIYRVIYKTNYELKPKIPFDKIYVEPHPYLPYIYKKNFVTSPSEKYNYPLNKNFFSAKLKTNNFGFYNGINGDREIKIPKPEKIYRINCLGGSTTANYVNDGKNNFSYPLELEKILKEKNANIEVNNCGTGGYNSADILVRFLLQTIETKPDLVILYHAYNDIKSYLTNNFECDYSHSRISLSKKYQQFKFNNKIPNLKIRFYNFLINKWFPTNIRSSLLDVISKGEVNLNNQYNKGLKVYERNLQNLIYLCKNNNIDMILCSFCFFLYQEAQDSKLHKLYQKIVFEENKIMKKLAEKNNIKFIDCDNKIPKEKDFFLDTIHLSPKGMKFIAEEISKAIN